MYDLRDISIAVIGLGYVGMPLALMLSRHFKTVGFDINTERVADLQKGWDSNREIKQADLRASSCHFTTNSDDLADCRVYIVTVPTPISENNEPDLGAVQGATRAVASYLKKVTSLCMRARFIPA